MAGRGGPLDALRRSVCAAPGPGTWQWHAGITAPPVKSVGLAGVPGTALQAGERDREEDPGAPAGLSSRAFHPKPAPRRSVSSSFSSPSRPLSASQWLRHTCPDSRKPGHLSLSTGVATSHATGKQKRRRGVRSPGFACVHGPGNQQLASRK